MAKNAPKKIVLAHDDYAAKYVGLTKDGRQFFLTSPFVPALDNPGREFLALYLFDKNGELLDAEIVDLGTRKDLDEASARVRHASLLNKISPVKYGAIKIVPFKVKKYGVEFGFIARPPEEPSESWSVIVEPGNYMCFWPPWDSGEYDT